MKQESINSLNQMLNVVYPSSSEWVVNQRVHDSSDCGEHNSNNNLQSTEVQDMQKIAAFWLEYNCDFYVHRLIFSLRQIAAYEILEFVHNRLTSHLIGHIYETAKELLTEQKQRSYMRLFGLTNENSKWGQDSQPLLSFFFEGTYAELLYFVKQQFQEGKRVKKEFMGALKAGERGLLDEAVGEGYEADEVGDIRWQMQGFKLLKEKFGRRNNYNDENKYSKDDMSVTFDGVSKDIVKDIRRATEDGDLGVLDRASKLIKLGCHFLERQWTRNRQCSWPESTSGGTPEVNFAVCTNQ